MESKTLLGSEHVGTDDEFSSSEWASEGDINEHNGYDSDKYLLVSD